MAARQPARRRVAGQTGRGVAEVGGTAVTELSRWLRAQRQGRSWNVPEMGRRLRRAATESGDTLPAGNACGR